MSCLHALARVDHALQTKPASAGSTSGAVSTATPAAAHPTVMAKLPKLALKHFHGTLTGWSPFWTHTRQLFIIIL